LWFGWYGFNAGSELQVDTVTALAFLNTAVAASFAAFVWLIIDWARCKKPRFLGLLTGAVAGLATITPGAGYVQPWAAAIIGLTAGAICYMACQLRSKLQWDDALDVWACHGVGGILGSILVGVFAFSGVNKVSGLIYGDLHQFLVQIFGVIVASVYAFAVTMLILKVISLFEPVRVSEEEEAMGLDEALIQESAYDLE
jgi:Amt family ammonium transporter